jgi:hypothetical protein
MGLSTTAKNYMLGRGLNNVSPTNWMQYAGLFTGDPDPDTGTQHEVTGGTPTYARKALTWAAASGGIMTASAQPTFDVPGGPTTVTHVGFFSAVTAGDYYGMADVTDETFNSQGTYTITSITVTLT